MTTMMSVALPATTAVHPNLSTGIMPRDLTETDGERLARAVSAARAESIRRV